MWLYLIIIIIIIIIIIMGDFNMKSITGLEHGSNAKLGKYMMR